MAIRDRIGGDRVLSGVRYALVFKGETLDRYDFSQGEGRITDLIGKVDRNPGMHIVAEVYHEPTDEADEQVVTSRRIVYPA